MRGEGHHCVADEPDDGDDDDDDDSCCALSVSLPPPPKKKGSHFLIFIKSGLARTDTRIDFLRFTRHGFEQRVRAQRIKVRASKVERARPRNVHEVERRIKTELARERPQNTQLFLVRLAHAQIEQSVESPRTQERRIEQIGPIGRAYNEYVLPSSPSRRRGRGRDAIEFGEELRDDTVHYASRVSVRAALWRDGVELVEEDDAGSGVARALEDSADVGFGLAYVHV